MLRQIHCDPRLLCSNPGVDPEVWELIMRQMEEDARITGTNPVLEAAEQQAFEDAMERGREWAREMRRDQGRRRKQHKERKMERVWV
jgi:hypothetical protein